MMARVPDVPAGATRRDSTIPSSPPEPTAIAPADRDGKIGRYEVLELLGQGGMGVVYEAMDERLDRRIAIKCAKTGFRKRLPPEVRHAREITHPNVCKIFEIHTARTPAGEIDFVTMEYLEGETLGDRLTRGPMPEAEARAIARQLCSGLAEAHSKGVIHGDLKSNNVILTKVADASIRPVITDFGMSRAPEAAQPTLQSGPRGGTPAHSAPWLFRCGRAAGRARCRGPCGAARGSG